LVAVRTEEQLLFSLFYHLAVDFSEAFAVLLHPGTFFTQLGLAGFLAGAFIIVRSGSHVISL
jgi:hypothetical protein